MKALFKSLVVLISFTVLLSAAEDLPVGEHVILKRAEGIATEVRQDTPLFCDLISRITITPEGSSPKSYIVSGRIVDNNAGAGRERILIRIGEKSEVPVVAAMTDVYGDFKFRLWIAEDARKLEVQVKEPFTASLYVGGRIDEMDAASPAIQFGTPVLKYQLADLLAYVKRQTAE